MPTALLNLGALTFIERVQKNFIEAGRWSQYLNGLKVTLLVSLMAVILGIILGVIIALMRLSKNKLLSGISGAYIDVIRGTPMVVQLMIFYFVLLGPTTTLDKTVIAAIAFGCNSAAYVAEIVRAGILSIDKGQTEAGRSLGLNEVMTLRYIILPQAFKNILPRAGRMFLKA